MKWNVPYFHILHHVRQKTPETETCSVHSCWYDKDHWTLLKAEGWHPHSFFWGWSGTVSINLKCVCSQHFLFHLNSTVMNFDSLKRCTYNMCFSAKHPGLWHQHYSLWLCLDSYSAWLRFNKLSAKCKTNNCFLTLSKVLLLLKPNTHRTPESN